MSSPSTTVSPNSLPTVQEGHVCILDFGNRTYFVKACRDGSDNQIKLGTASKGSKTYTTGEIGQGAEDGRLGGGLSSAMTNNTYSTPHRLSSQP